MEDIQFMTVTSHDHDAIGLIANWYLQEWKIPKEKTIENLKTVTSSVSQFQLLLTVDGIPVSTGGIYNHISLINKLPRLAVYKYWLALVYTVDNKRSKGYGALLCKQIEEQATRLGLDKIHLFTDTAERLYLRLGWQILERVTVEARNIVIMEKHLTGNW